MKKNFKKYSIKSLAILLSILMVLLSFPLSVLAIERETVGSTDIYNNKNIIELNNKRTETTKQFRLEDGSYMIAQYDTTIHYLDENNQWQDIDNTLSVSGNEITTNNAKIKFAKKITGNETLFALHNVNQKLTLSLNGATKKTLGTITNYTSELGENATELQKMTELTKISASVKYENILPNTDLEYIVRGNDIKENIIVKEKQDQYSYSFTMSLNNLVAELTNTGEIHVSDAQTAETVYVIPAPIMWDNNMNYSDAVHMELINHKNGTYTITVIADHTWINNDERTFPITIDPPIYKGSNNAVLDIDISTDTPNEVSINDNMLWIGHSWRAYWKLLSLPEIPSSAYISTAQIRMKCYSSSSGTGYVGVYDVLSDWNETLTWSKVTASSNAQGVPASNYTDCQNIKNIAPNSDDNGDLNCFSWNITPIIKKWYNGQNYGITFAPISDTALSDDVYFHSDQAFYDNNRPRLTISYRYMNGLEDYWSYSSQSAGFAGAGSIHHSTGNLTFAIPTLTTTDSLMPFSPTLVYNSAFAGAEYTNAVTQTPYTSSYTPLGFKLNIGETLVKKDYTNWDGTVKQMFVLNDSDGTEHFFLSATPPENITLNATQTYYEDEDGLLLQLIEDSLNGICTITDSGKNIRTFSSMSGGWYLSSITDKNGNKVTFSFDNYHRPISVNLVPYNSTSITQLELAYNSNGKLYLIWNPVSKDAVILRYSSSVNGNTVTSGGTYLRQVIRAHGASSAANWLSFYNSNANENMSSIGVTVDAVANYVYGSANTALNNRRGLLLSVTNQLTTYQIAYEYQSNKVVSVKEFAGATLGTLGQALSITYHGTSTVIRTSGQDDQLNTSDDLLTTYSFDSEGRTVSCYTTDLERTQIFGASGGEYVGEENEKAKNNLKSSVQTTQQSSNYLVNGDFEENASNSIPYWSTLGNIAVGNNVYSASLTVDANNSQSAVFQYVSLDKGEYSIGMSVLTYEATDVELAIKIESLSNAAHNVTEQVSTNKYFASDTQSVAGTTFSADPSEVGGKETFKISIVLTGTLTEGSKNVTVDNIMLSKTTGIAEFDMLDYGHFETGTYAPNRFWKYTSNASTNITVVDSTIDAFGDVLKLNGDFGGLNVVQQVIYQGSENDKVSYDHGYDYPDDSMMFTVSGWAKGTAQAYSEDAKFEIQIEIQYYIGNGNVHTVTQTVPFDKDLTDWQFVSLGLITAEGLVDKITVKLVYENHPGDAYFDSISVVKDSGTTGVYQYNAQGYVYSAKEGWNTEWYDYDDHNNLIKAVSSNKSIVDYTYDSCHRVMRETYKKYTGIFNTETQTVVGTETAISYNTYTYNDQGLVTVMQTVDYDSTNKQTYSEIGYHVTAGSRIFGAVDYEKDALSNITRYFYDQTNGRLLAVLYPDCNGVSYTYNAIGNLVQTMPAYATASENADYMPDDMSAAAAYYYNSANQLTRIATGSTLYDFVYDVFGNTTNISAGDHTLAGYEYNSNNGKLHTLTYGNGHKVKYLYDALDRISQICYNTGEGGAFETVYSYTYDTAGNVFSIEDHVNGEVTYYKYDSLGRFVKSYVYDTEDYYNLYEASVVYDEQSRIAMVFHTVDYICPSTSYHGNYYYDFTFYSCYYDSVNGRLSSWNIISPSFSGYIDPVYDDLGKTTSRIISFNTRAFYNELSYEYVSAAENRQTGLVSAITSTIGSGENAVETKYQYTYDANGNITQIRENNVIQYRYQYDSLGQLVREDNRPLNYSYVYHYDYAGNLTSKVRYAFTTGALGAAQKTDTYTYGDATWGDLLTKFNWDEIEYDEIGNPIKIGSYDEAAGRWDYYYELQWEGRQLKRYEYFELYFDDIYYNDYLVEFTYNADGIRTSKNGRQYLLNGSQIFGEQWKEGRFEHLLIYLYDENGSPIGLKFRKVQYQADVFDCFFFEKNLQGDIIAIYNASGTKIGTYTYDAWGNCTVTTTAGITELESTVVNTYNPFRYRGYYYDVETGFYYLQSRYYNPTWGRFLNADGYVSTGQGLLGYNMYAYCNNNPVSFIDPQGDSLLGVIALFTLGIGSVLGLSSCSNSSQISSSNNNSETNTTIKSSNERDANIAGFESLHNIAASHDFDREYGFIVYQYNDGNPYGENPDNYWTSPIKAGISSEWDPNRIDIPWDYVTIISVVHLHVDNDPRLVNGGFSGKDFNTVKDDREICSNHYVMVLGRVIQGYEGRYQVYKFDYAQEKGVLYYAN